MTIKKMRERRGLTQEEAAKIAQVSKRQWKRWEYGENIVPTSRLYDVCRILECKLPILLKAIEEARGVRV